MSIATLSDIITKIRKLTGSANNQQITDDEIKDYINSFYLYDLPAEFRSLKLKDKYTFNTIQGIDTYAFDSEHYTTVDMPCYCAKREIKLFQDPWSFYGVNYNWQFQTVFTYGSGSIGPYSGNALVGQNATNAILRSVNSQYQNAVLNINYPAGYVQNILITANTTSGTLNVTDDGLGNLNEIDSSGNVTATNIGTINYQTGAIANLIFSQTIPGGNPIQIQYNPLQLSIPLSIMFFQNQFTLRPVPNQGYTIELVAYRQPTQALMAPTNQTGTPELNEWWELLAFGAAKKIYEDRLDPDGVMLMDKSLVERYTIAEARTYAQISTQSIQTIYSGQLMQNYGNTGWGFGNGGSV